MFLYYVTLILVFAVCIKAITIIALEFEWSRLKLNIIPPSGSSL
jgi:hypothetical protein